MKKLHLRPAEGLRVRLETGEVFPAEGCEVPNTRYYRKRVKDGDLVKVEAKQAPKKGAK